MQLIDFIKILNYPTITIAGQEISVGQWLMAPLVFIVGYLLTKWLISTISKRLVARQADPNLVHLISRLIYILAIAVLVVTTLDLINVPITAFAFLSGAIAIGIGFGAQNIINNFISGWILMWERPIRIGDFLEVDDAKGVVEEINTRSTRIRRIDGVHMLIPNSKLLENTVINWTLVDNLVRTSVRVGVSYGSPAKKVAELIMQATVEQKEVLIDPKPWVIFEDFGDNSLIFDVYFWVNSNVEGGLRVVRSNIRFRLEALFSENQIVIAFPQQDVHIDGAITLLNK
ncbi:mechanosensitive ion channel family protein [Psychromonas antarctica]|uniref:mechanosensitive ion channel family protein n=1 Tax=Psychromonas antarctica TaxID=67573 RepID=UPI001EE993BF|nr:mechanosensitive ion channel domain-containing protein [Psychromonas antarctica]MCG6201598.1 mechanosensitive ion channel [Psychromonas antarctica]